MYNKNSQLLRTFEVAQDYPIWFKFCYLHVPPKIPIRYLSLESYIFIHTVTWERLSLANVLNYSITCIS